MGPKFGLNKPKSCPKLGFSPFSQVWFISFIEIAYSGSLQQCLRSSRGKTHEKNFWAQIWTKIRPEIRSFTIFLSLVLQFSFILHRMIAWVNVQPLAEVRSTQKNLRGPNLNQRSQNWAQNQVFSPFCEDWFIYFFWKLHRMIAWSNVQLLTEVKST